LTHGPPHLSDIPIARKLYKATAFHLNNQFSLPSPYSTSNLAVPNLS
jgi:hypothetical protein